MTTTADQDAIVAEIHVAARPEKVFQALVDSSQIPLWWGQAGIYRCTKFAADLRVGGQWCSSGLGPDGRDFQVTGEDLEIDPPRLLVHSWIASWTGDARTIVRWELIPTDQGTLVKLRHSGLAAYPAIAQSYQGWPRMLGWLQAFLEKGETVATRKAS